MLLVVGREVLSMRDNSTFPMEEVDVHLLSDILEHFLGEDRNSTQSIRDELETVQDGYNPSFERDMAEDIIDDLSRIVERAPSEMFVEDVTEYEPQSDAAADFLDLSVKSYVKTRRDYFQECHTNY